MLQAIGTLLAFQVAGEVVAHFLDLPVPGPVVGMALLVAAMAAAPAIAARLRDTASGLLQHLSLLFVPAGVGVMLHVDRVAHEWIAIATALVVGTAVTVAVTGLAIKFCARLLGQKRSEGEA